MTTIIAEAGVNHNGSLDKAFELVKIAKEANADIVKFQKFNSASLASKTAEKANYQKITTNQKQSQLSMLKELELSDDEFVRLRDFCNQLKIEFLASAFDNESLNFLVKELGLKKLKIASGEITNAPLLLSHSRYNCDIILSTGMATIDEIRQALKILSYGYLSKSKSNPCQNDFEDCFNSSEGKKILKNKVTLLHCTSEYPTIYDNVNLRAMDTIRETFGLDTGYSDHTEGILTSIAAVAKEASIIEKHFTINKNLDGPDHRSSLEPGELKLMCREIRKIERILGSRNKSPSFGEIENLKVVRKSIIAAKTINIGEKFSEENIDIKRPGSGISPNSYWDLIGKISQKKYNKDDLIS